MYTISYDRGKNRVFITIKGFLTRMQKIRYVDDIIQVIDMTSPGYTVCANLSEGDLSLLENYSELSSVREYAVKKGIGKVAYIISQYALDKHKEKPFHGLVNVFSSFSDAYKFLEPDDYFGNNK